jgi:hypothetical protein
MKTARWKANCACSADSSANANGAFMTPDNPSLTRRNIDMARPSTFSSQNWLLLVEITLGIRAATSTGAC